MKYEILFLGKTRDSFLSQGIDEYYKRLKHYTDIKLKTIKTKKIQGSDEVIKEKEASLLLSQMNSSAYVVALDSVGNAYTSMGFARRIDGWERRNLRNISFIIGGPLGLSKDLLKRADESISLSKMTFTHDMVRLFLLEQLYRAYTIKAGEQYHK